MLFFPHVHTSVSIYSRETLTSGTIDEINLMNPADFFSFIYLLNDAHWVVIRLAQNYVETVLTPPYTPMERSPLHRLPAKWDNEVGQAEVWECIGVYGHSLVHESRDRAVGVATLLSGLAR